MISNNLGQLLNNTPTQKKSPLNERAESISGYRHRGDRQIVQTRMHRRQFLIKISDIHEAHNKAHIDSFKRDDAEITFASIVLPLKAATKSSYRAIADNDMFGSGARYRCVVFQTC